MQKKKKKKKNNKKTTKKQNKTKTKPKNKYSRPATCITATRQPRVAPTLLCTSLLGNLQ